MTSSPGHRMAGYPDTPDGSRDLAAHLRNDHGIKAIYRRPTEDHAAHTLMHYAAHENDAAARATMRDDEGNGRVLVSAASTAGQITYEMAADTDEYVRVTPVYAFTCQGRRYNGVILLKRAGFTPELRYPGNLTEAGLGLPASGAAFSMISLEVAQVVKAHVAAHPEVTAAGNRAAARFRASQLARQITDTENRLKLLRAQHAQLAEAAGRER